MGEEQGASGEGRSRWERGKGRRARVEGEEICIKLHRLGRNCFRTVKNNRDYLKANQSASWLYLSRLSSLKE